METNESRTGTKRIEIQVLPITGRVKIFEDACRELGESHPFVQAWKAWDIGGLNGQPDIEAYLKLRIICAALNEGWKPEFTKGENRWYPWFWLYTDEELKEMDADEKLNLNMMSTNGYVSKYVAFAYANSHRVPARMLAHIGYHLCLKNSDLAMYCGKQFIQLWADFCLVRKP